MGRRQLIILFLFFLTSYIFCQPFDSFCLAEFRSGFLTPKKEGQRPHGFKPCQRLKTNDQTLFSSLISSLLPYLQILTSFYYTPLVKCCFISERKTRQNKSTFSQESCLLVIICRLKQLVASLPFRDNNTQFEEADSTKR